MNPRQWLDLPEVDDLTNLVVKFKIYKECDFQNCLKIF